MKLMLHQKRPQESDDSLFHSACEVLKGQSCTQRDTERVRATPWNKGEILGRFSIKMLIVLMKMLHVSLSYYPVKTLTGLAINSHLHI